MERKIKIIILSVLAVLVIGAVGGIIYLHQVNGYKEKVQAIEIGTVNLDNIKDGEYKGSCNVDFIEAEVLVKVKAHKIDRIDILKHKNGKGKPAEAIVDKVIDKQSLQVDAISGATNSSKVILKAIEDALNKGK